MLGILVAVALTVFITLHWGYRTFFNKKPSFINCNWEYMPKLDF